MGKVLHASASGYFPFCLTQYEQNPFTPFYQTIDLASAMRIWWRIKKFRFYGTYVLNPETDPETRNWEFVVERNSASEEELVCNPTPEWITEFTLNTYGIFGFSLPYIFQEGSDYVIDSSFGAAFVDGAQEQGISYISVYDTILKTYNFEGVTYYMTGDNNTYNEFTTINHEILEYWSYGGTYDTSTGLPL
jgi:hypothetical protein